MCDTLALLSKGRLIYMGNASDAAKFFIESPTMPLALETEFDNPADFLYNVSANLLRDSKVCSAVLKVVLLLAIIFYMFLE